MEEVLMSLLVNGISVKLPPNLNEEISSIAKKEKKSVPEVLKDALINYTTLRFLAKIRAQIKRTNKRIKRSYERLS
jgi:hypothetical protein